MIALEAGLLVEDKFELLAELGRGGMGSVWRARDRRLGRDVAIKFISTRVVGGVETERVTRVRFEREARAAASLATRHVVQIFEFGVDGDTPFLVMELLRGESLSARLRRVRSLSLEEAGTLVTQMAIGLEVAHGAGIVHRDLKPANVFLAESDGEEVAKVLDFGIAKALAPDVDLNITDSNTIMGTPSYMAPEQVRRAAEVDGRADVWSLGVILFRVITGTRPFQARSAGDLIAQIVSDPLPRASTLLPEPLPGIDAFFERALARDPTARFGSARELASSFAELLQATGHTAPSLPPRWVSSTPAPPPSERRASLPSGSGAGTAREVTQASGTVYASSARANGLLARPRRLAAAAAISGGVVLGLGTVLLAVLRSGGRGEAAPASVVEAAPVEVAPPPTATSVDALPPATAIPTEEPTAAPGQLPTDSSAAARPAAGTSTAPIPPPATAIAETSGAPSVPVSSAAPAARPPRPPAPPPRPSASAAPAPQKPSWY